MEPLRLQSANVVVNDLDAMVDFLTGMGFELVSDALLEGPWLNSVLRIDDAKLNYLQFDGPYGGCQINVLKYVNPPEIAPSVDPQVPYAGQIRMIGILCENLEEAVETALKLGARFVGEGTQIAGDYRLCYIMGPDNVIFMLTEQRPWQEIANRGADGSDNPWENIKFF